LLVAWRSACHASSPGLIRLGNGISPLAGLSTTLTRHLVAQAASHTLCLRHMRIRPVSRRRPPSFRALNDLIASRQRLRQRIGFLLAICLPLGLLLLEFE